MVQLPDVVMTLLLIGVDMNTTTELRRDILCSISVLCRRLPAEPGDSTVRRNVWFRCPNNSQFPGGRHCKQSVGPYENHFSL
jgi:hypothetical protein